MISEKGNLQDLLFGKLLLDLYEKSVTGILYLRIGGILKEIYFDQGKIIWAISTAENEKLDHLLIEEAQLPKDEVDNLKKEHHFSSTVSFLLEEKGMVNKNQLVLAFQKQVKRILFHIIETREGEYNFVYGLTPKKSIDLELSVPDCLRQVIADNSKTDYIWRFFGSENAELKRNPISLESEPPSIPNSEEIELLGNFENWTKISSVLSQYDDAERDRIIRSVFLFTICGILERSDNSAVSTSPANQDDSQFPEADLAFLDSLKSNLSAPPPVEEHFPVPEEEQIELNIPEPPDKPPLNLSQEQPFEEFPELPSDEELPQIFPVTPPISSRQGSPLLKILIISIFIIVLASAGFYFFKTGVFSSGEKKAGNQTVEKKSQGKIENSAESDQIPPTKDVDQSQTEGQAPFSQKTDRTGDELSTSATVQETVPPPGKDIPEIKPSPTQSTQSKATPVASPMILFEQGKLFEAGEEWRKELLKTEYRFTVLLELDCAKESVFSALDQFDDKRDFFILNRNRDGKKCYLVMWGRFLSEADAHREINRIPSFFFQQQNPPIVVDMTPYLR